MSSVCRHSTSPPVAPAGGGEQRRARVRRADGRRHRDEPGLGEHRDARDERGEHGSARSVSAMSHAPWLSPVSRIGDRGQAPQAVEHEREHVRLRRRADAEEARHDVADAVRIGDRRDRDGGPWASPTKARAVARIDVS